MQQIVQLKASHTLTSGCGVAVVYVRNSVHSYGQQGCSLIEERHKQNINVGIMREKGRSITTKYLHQRAVLVAI